MSMKFASDIKNMKLEILSNLDFRFCAFRAGTEPKMIVCGIHALSAVARVWILDKKMFRYFKLPTVFTSLHTYWRSLLSHLFLWNVDFLRSAYVDTHIVYPNIYPTYLPSSPPLVLSKWTNLWSDFLMVSHVFNWKIFNKRIFECHPIPYASIHLQNVSKILGTD